jgi:hypothetical protein
MFMRRLKVYYKESWLWLLLPVALIIVFTTAGSPVKIHPKYVIQEPVYQTVLPEDEFFTIAFPPFVGRSFNGFKEALGFKESKGNYGAVNRFGYLGKYQFGISTLKSLGVHDIDFFLQNPEIQERVFMTSLERNKGILSAYIERFDHTYLNGIRITESGILAAAHLAGVENVKRYFYSKGVRTFTDANGASVRYYLKKFSGYDLSGIIANEAAKL